MNNERRKQIAEAVSLIEAAREKLDEAKELIEAAKDEEQEYYDNMPESFQSGEKGDRAQEAVSALEDAYSEIENIDIDSIVGRLEAVLE